MRRINYTRYVEEDFGLSAEDLIRALGDFLLESGFQSQYYGFSEFNAHSLEQLKDALRRALESGDLFDQQQADQVREQLASMTPEQLDQVLDRLAAKLRDEGYLSQQDTPRGVKLEITDKAVDFLGFKALKDLMGALGRSSFGAHETRALSTGVESSGGSRPWEFGDTLNLDSAATLFSALRHNANASCSREYLGTA